MKVRVIVKTAAAVLFTAGIFQTLVHLPASRAAVAPAAVRSALPTDAGVKTILNTTYHHREWVTVTAGSSAVHAFIVYPWRSDNAPVVMITSKTQGASDWVRAVGDQVAGEGFIAVVPDLLSGLGPNGGDSNSFPNIDAVAKALANMNQAEMTRRINAVRQYAISVPAANGKSASLEFYSGPAGKTVRAEIASPAAGQQNADFRVTAESWPEIVSFLNKQTANHPINGSDLVAMLTAQGRGARGGRGPAGYPTGKLADLPAGLFNARSTLTNSKMRKEFVNIPLGNNVNLHTWVEYPEGNGKAPIVVVMQHGPGMDEWVRALTDQLAVQGFIAIAPDLHSGFGPNGGNYESFGGVDAVMRANARITREEGMRRYKAAYDWGMKLQRANGKSATVGFCMGGGYSFRFAGDVPDINAAVVYYGATPDEATMAKIKAPVLAFYGENDARVTAAAEPTSARMKRLGKSFEFHVYPSATHGFLEFQDLGGNPAATSDSWARTIAFLKEYTK